MLYSSACSRNSAFEHTPVVRRQQTPRGKTVWEEEDGTFLAAPGPSQPILPLLTSSQDLGTQPSAKSDNSDSVSRDQVCALWMYFSLIQKHEFKMISWLIHDFPCNLPVYCVSEPIRLTNFLFCKEIQYPEKKRMKWLTQNDPTWAFFQCDPR